MAIGENERLFHTRSLMVIVPHQDDEILLAAGLIRHALQRHIPVDVVMATNGDFGCHDHTLGRTRLRESLAGLALLGLPAKRFHILGYADTGMPAKESFLTRLYWEQDSKLVFCSGCGSQTYGLEEKPEVHKERFGCHGWYNRETFCQDLRELLRDFRPESIVTTAPMDQHGDHSALYAFVCEVLKSLEGSFLNGCQEGEKKMAEGPFFTGKYRPRLYAGMIHSCAGDENWPERNTDTYSAPAGWEEYTKKPNLWAWSKRITLPVPDEMRLERGRDNLKLRSLLQYETALEPGARDYLLSFVKNEEIFWESAEPWEDME